MRSHDLRIHHELGLGNCLSLSGGPLLFLGYDNLGYLTLGAMILVMRKRKHNRLAACDVNIAETLGIKWAFKWTKECGLERGYFQMEELGLFTLFLSTPS